MDYGRDLGFGISVLPDAGAADVARRLAVRADGLGLDLVGVQDHPYQHRFVDTFALISDLLARTERISVFPDVANLPLRGAAMLAKAAASLDVLSRGRFELGLGAGAFWDAIAAMGGPSRSPRESLEALEEAIALIRAFWAGGTVERRGEYYSVHGAHAGPPPAHDIGIWVGGYKPRMLDLIGRVADGWVPSLPYAPPEVIPDMMERVDAGAAAAGRDPRDVRRLYNLTGEITDGARGDGLVGPAGLWVEQLAGFTALGFDSYVFWPGGDEPEQQVERFAEVAASVRATVDRDRSPGPAR